MWSNRTRQLIELACEEDLNAAGDITAFLLPPRESEVTGRLVPRQPGVICGLALGPLICETFARRLQRPLRFTVADRAGRQFQDGDGVERGACVATLFGSQPALLAAERTLLNFLGRMSGVATLTRRYVAAARAGNAGVAVLDTRKTVPGWRELDKYAVRAGGGENHRSGLYDAILIKDNHLAGIPIDQLAQTLSAWLAEASATRKFIEVEVDSLAQLAEVCKVPAVNMVLLDNFSLADMRAAVQYRDEQGLRGQVALEASGGVTLENIAAIAATGVERISVGALTHSAAALDIGLDL